MLVAVLGGLLGILMMIPLRRALIVKQHGMLKYPEGTACAEVLKAGARRGAGVAARAREAGTRRRSAAAPPAPRPSSPASAIGLVYKTLMTAFKLWKDTPEKVFGEPFKAGSVSRRDLARAARRRLHHRPAHRLDHVRRRRARLPGADPGDQVLRRRRDRRRSRPARCPIARDGPGRDPRRLRPLHRRRRGGRGRHHQPVPVAAARSGTASKRRPRATCAAARGRRRGRRPRTDRDLSIKFVVGGIVALVAVICCVAPDSDLQSEPARARC